MGITNYTVYEKSNCSKSELLQRLTQSNISVMGYRYSGRVDGDCITLNSKADSLLFHNSLIPKVVISISEKDDSVQTEIKFKLNDISKVAFCVLNAVLILMSVVMLLVVLSSAEGFAVVFIAPLILAFLYAMTFFGLRLSSRRVLREIKELL